MPPAYRQPSFESMEPRVVLSSQTLWSPEFPSRAMLLGSTNDTTLTATHLGTLTTSRSVGGWVGGTDPRDVYRFYIPEASQLDVSLTELQADVDLLVLNQDREVIARSDVAGVASEQVRVAIPAGRYYVVVQPYRTQPRTPFRLRLERMATAAQDAAGATLATAANIGSLQEARTLSGSIGRDHDRLDLIRFSVTEQSTFTAQLDGLRADADLYLLSSGQQIIGASRSAGVQSEQVAATLVPGTTYYLAVAPATATGTNYELSLQADVLVEAPTPTPNVPEENLPLPEVAYFGGSRDWGVNVVQAPEAWAAGYTGQGVTVAIVDSGMQWNHPDLVDRVWRNVDEIFGDGIDNDGNGYIDDVVGWDFVSQDNTPQDPNRHGTHVAGVVAAANDGRGATGVAFDAQIMPVRVLGADGSGSNAAVAAGIRYAVDNGADIINLSLGGGYDRRVHAALQYAEQQDVLVVAAAGNEAAVAPAYPAALSRLLPNVISVGAFDRGGNVASFSNDVGRSGAVQVDAPGVGIYSTVPEGQYRSLSGTSMAAPHVAGVAALVLSANPALTSAELRATLAGEGAPGQVNGSDGRGAVSAAAAISHVRSLAIA